MAIMSSIYGLVDSEEIIELHEEVLTKERAKELLDQVIEKIKAYDFVVYFRDGAGMEYYNLIQSEKAWRFLGPNRVVHHIDGNKNHNRGEQLARYE